MPISPIDQNQPTGHGSSLRNSKEANNTSQDVSWRDINVTIEAMNHAQEQQSYEEAAQHAYDLYYKRQKFRQRYSEDERLRDALRHSDFLLHCPELGNKHFPPGIDDLVPLAGVLNAEEWGLLCSNMGILFLRQSTQQNLERSKEYFNMGLKTLVSAKSQSPEVLHLICQSLVDIHELTYDLGGAKAFVEEIRADITPEVWDKIKVGNITTVIKWCANHGFESRLYQYHQNVQGHELSPIAESLKDENKTVFETMLGFGKKTLPPAVFSYICSKLLPMATSMRNMNNTRTLVENGADVRYADEQGRTALHHCCQWSLKYKNEGGPDIASYLIGVDMKLFEGKDIEAEISLINRKDKAGKTALIMACEVGHHAMIDLLIAKGANPSIKDLYGKTCLYVAVERGDIRSVKTLCRTPQIMDMINEPGPGQATPIIMAVEKASKNIRLAEIAKRLIRHGALPHLVDTEGKDAFAYVGGEFDKKWLKRRSGSDSGRSSMSLPSHIEPASPENPKQTTSRSGSSRWRSPPGSSRASSFVPSIFSKRSSTSTFMTSESQINQPSEANQLSIPYRGKDLRPEESLKISAKNAAVPDFTDHHSQPMQPYRSSRHAIDSTINTISEEPDLQHEYPEKNGDDHSGHDEIEDDEAGDDEGAAEADDYDTYSASDTDSDGSTRFEETIDNRNVTEASSELFNPGEWIRQHAPGNQHTPNQSQAGGWSSTHSRGQGNAANHPGRATSHTPGRDNPSSKKRQRGIEDNVGPQAGQEYRFACPLYQKDPFRHQQCLHYLLRRVRDVKQHLIRVHHKPYCSRCEERFANDLTKDAHIRANLCSPATHLASLDWVTDHQKNQDLKDSPRDLNGDDVAQWQYLYTILFPNEIPPAPFYNRYLLFEHFQDFATARFLDVMRRHMGHNGLYPATVFETTLNTSWRDFPTRFGPLYLGFRIQYTTNRPQNGTQSSQTPVNPRNDEIANQSTATRPQVSTSPRYSHPTSSHNNQRTHGNQVYNSPRTQAYPSASTNFNHLARGTEPVFQFPVAPGHSPSLPHQTGAPRHPNLSRTPQATLPSTNDRVHVPINRTRISGLPTRAPPEQRMMSGATGGTVGSSTSQVPGSGQYDFNRPAPLLAHPMGGGLEDLATGQENFGAGLENFGASLENFGVGPDDFNAGQESFGEGLNNFNAGQEIFNAVQENFGTGQENFGAGQENFEAGEEDFSDYIIPGSNNPSH
ncbi:hypothetical protein G7054_g6614 [Neopestalotiopsis clavispora]|nr:hypothetical protein G7054_g6614 [Neopestalotiopsis clavispora]